MVETLQRDSFMDVKERQAVKTYDFYVEDFHVLRSEFADGYQVTKWPARLGSLGAVPVVLRMQRDYVEQYTNGQGIAVATIEHGRDNPVVHQWKLEDLMADPESFNTLVLNEHFTSFRIDMYGASFGYDASVPLRRGFIFAISQQDISPILVERVKTSGIHPRFETTDLQGELQRFSARLPARNA